MTEASWLKQVQAHERMVPGWMRKIFDHPMFLSLQRQDDGSWFLFTTAELEFESEELDDVCHQFAKHFGI